MKNSYYALPEDYSQKEVIDFKNNKKQRRMLRIVSLILPLPLIVAMFFFEYSFVHSGVAALVALSISIPAIILTLVFYELIHGIFFKIFGKGRLKFAVNGSIISCAMPGVFFSKTAYIIIGLSPFIILSTVFVVLSVIFYNALLFLPFYLSLIVNFSFSIGNFYVLIRLIRLPKTVLVSDSGMTMTFYDVAPQNPDEYLLSENDNDCAAN